VIGLTKLRKNYKSYEDRRKLLRSYDLFVADEKVVTFLPALLGKVFYEKKKQPVPVRIRGSVAGPVQKVLGSTFAYLNSGVCM
jgi:ribosome biogenesis protein UTP30